MTALWHRNAMELLKPCLRRLWRSAKKLLLN